MTRELIFGLALGLQVAGWFGVAHTMRRVWRELDWSID